MSNENGITEQNKQTGPRMMTIRAAAAVVPMAEHALRGMVKRGEAPGFYSGTRFYVNYDRLIDKLNAM